MISGLGKASIRSQGYRTARAVARLIFPEWAVRAQFFLVM
jgi:hypothetical protein